MLDSSFAYCVEGEDGPVALMATGGHYLEEDPMASYLRFFTDKPK